MDQINHKNNPVIANKLPNEVIAMILDRALSSTDFGHMGLLNRQWAYEARRISSKMKTKFARQIIYDKRHIIYDFDVRLHVVGYGKAMQRHGKEEVVQTFHRVGGSGCDVVYLERMWKEDKLEGEEVVREINSIWHDLYWKSNSNKINRNQPAHPYDGITAVDSMRENKRHFLVTPDQINFMPDGCDYLGKLLIRHEWKSQTLKDSLRVRRQLFSANEDMCDSIASLYQFLNEFSIGLAHQK
ncbi:unnamed protein product [Didymodactylos carnosus]|uniref:F-box domain-containing protein n=1 Tax=Didymodactylos carnosus TaxID=1234261 RepID=A0A815WQH2_9BILA|nr:unnamed protein product [Didymodactylos carnosus]CAF4405386.1 unnamed protein product [Didymodactylos carnosus]